MSRRSVIKQCPGTIASGVIGLLVQTVFAIVWAVSAFGVYRLVIDSESPYVKVCMQLMVLLLFLCSMHWTGEIFRNTVHVTVAGGGCLSFVQLFKCQLISDRTVFATYFFTGVNNSDGSVHVPVHNPTLKAAKRALTTSFGSIALDSSCLHSSNAGGNFQRQLIALQRDLRDNPSLASSLLLRISRIYSCPWLKDALVIFVHKYAYCDVAIYGKA
ncbi:hypothetical protein DFS34DRAFT_116874 [Phlyctochytrium arcticum]|nr:hypothetical protein DFS34DRAFT_116874 [Phlyctochytrium arcticum]